MFEIHLITKHNLANNIDTTTKDANEEGKGRFVKFNEYEVILMPQFCFQVVNIRKHPKRPDEDGKPGDTAGDPVTIIEV